MLDPVGFWSYAHQDDAHSDGQLSQLRAIVGKQIVLQCGDEVKLWQDIVAILFGARLAQRNRADDRADDFLYSHCHATFLEERTLPGRIPCVSRAHAGDGPRRFQSFRCITSRSTKCGPRTRRSSVMNWTPCVGISGSTSGRSSSRIQNPRKSDNGRRNWQRVFWLRCGGT